MKKRLISLLLAGCMILLGVMGLTACDDKTPSTTPQKLSAPVITLTENVASWKADPNADKFEISLDGSLSYVENSVTSKTLTHGQTLKIRAVGDGSAYTTSDWSNVVTYQAPTQDTQAPVEDATNAPVEDVTAAPTEDATNAPVEDATDASVEDMTNAPVEDATNAPVEDATDAPVEDATNAPVEDMTNDPTETPVVPVTGEPQYMGIFASSGEPSSADGLPDALVSRTMRMSYLVMAGGSYRSFGTALDEYFADSNHHFNANFPEESQYDIYSAPDQTVYIQIWLNNPDQHTILSLKLNGTKYQVGGGLSSFFIREGGQHYNCVYVAVIVPSDTYTEKTYTVSDIEYIADTYINADGTDEFMNNNDTVSVGLPYSSQKPNVSDFSIAELTVNGCSATFSLTDATGLVDLSGGWLGVAVYDGNNIITNQAVTVGNNSISATGLVEDTTYWVTVYLYADLHNGNGVTAHVLYERNIQTTQVITLDEIDGALLYDSEKDGYYGAIKVNTTLNSNTAEYIKLEILKDNEVVYADTTYNGTATVSAGILCGNSYNVRVYYKDIEYPEGKYVEENVWIDNLGTPWYSQEGTYSFASDMVHYFQFNNMDENYPAIHRLAIKYYDEDSARWVAGDVLYLLDNPTAIEDLNAQIDALREQFDAAYGNHELMNEIHAVMSALEERRAPLDKAQWYLDYRADESCDRAYWEAEAAKGKYFYVFEYSGVDTEKMFKVDKTYYTVLDGALTLDGGSQYRTLKVDIDYETVNGVCDTTKTSVSVENLFICNLLELRDLEINGNSMTFSLVNIDDYMLPDGGESNYEKGYLYKVVAYPGTIDETVLYLNETNTGLDVDEDAWFAEYIRRIKAGESVEGLYDQFIPKYNDAYTVTIDASKLGAGLTPVQIYTRFMVKEYAEGEYEDCVYEHLTVTKRLDKPTVVFEADGGRAITVSEDGFYNGYEYEAKDKNGNPVLLEMLDSDRFALPAVGTQVRAKRLGDDSWLESEWSEWYTFEGIQISAPGFGEYNTTSCKISWSADTTNVSHYLYTLNGGTSVRVEINGNCSLVLNNGDVLRVKCVASEAGLANGYLDSDWAEYTCVDNRTALATPSNVKIENGMISWDEVEGATYYILESVLEDGRTIERRVDKLSTGASSNVVSFRVRAMTDDFENYRPSNFSASIANTSEKG